MKPDYKSVTISTPLQKVVKLIEQTDQTALPVVDERGLFLGIIRFQDIRPVYSNIANLAFLLAGDIMIKDAPVAHELDSLDMVLKTFELSDAEMLPVLASDGSNKLVGIVNNDDALRRYRKEILVRSEQ